MSGNDLLRNARVQRHWTQSTLAAQLNTTRVTIVHWEQGKTSPGLYFRERLCDLFGLTEQALGLDQRSTETRLSRTWLIAEERNSFFTGRETILQQLHEAFGKGNKSSLGRVQIITGLAGVGKTQVALEYAYRSRQHYSAVIWLRAETYEMLSTDLVKVGTALQLAMHEQDETQREGSLRNWLETTSKWLLIFDNVEELALVYKVLPAHDLRGDVVITTRMQATGRFSHQFNLEEMDLDQSALLLLRRAKLLPLHSELMQAPSHQRVLAARLCQELGGLPLAIDQAGAYIEETGCGLAGYLERFQQRCSRLLSWRGQDTGGYPFSVTTTLLMAQERIGRQSPVAFELLCLCLFLCPDNIPESLITHGASHLGSLIQAADILSLDDAFAILNASALLRRDPETHLLSIHRLVQLVLRDWLEEEIQHLWLERVLRALYYLFPAHPDHEEAVWPLCELLLPHIQNCSEQVGHLTGGKQPAQIVSICSTLLLKVADYMFERARYQEAESLLNRSLNLANQVHASGYQVEVPGLRTLALCHERLNRYHEAASLAGYSSPLSGEYSVYIILG
jgi:transcriptional regulator with XRE-family HTH domain